MKNKFNTATFLRQLALLLIAVMLTASAAWAEDDVPSINGLSYNSTGGYYEIPDADALNALASYVNSGHDCSGMSFKVTGNIDFNPSSTITDNFSAIGNWDNPFKGNFDGDGKKISGIRIDKPDDVDQGLFGCIYNANVENIILTDTQITGWQGVSGIAGCCHESTIRNCIVDNVFVNGSRKGCGGIAGSVNGSLVGNLVVNSTITVANPSEYIYTGAITGDSYDGSLENNYYYNCKVIVGETENTTDVGCGQNGTLPHDIDGALQAVQISAAEGISFEITSNNSIPYKDQIYVGVGTTVTLTITDVNGYQYYTNGKGVYFTNVDGNSSNFTVTDANDIVITGTNEDPVEGKISISAIDDQITILPKGNAVLLDGKCYAEVGATVTLAITDIYKPDEGYTVSGYTYAEGESLTKNADGNYTFTVPSDDVTISRVITDVWNVENGADGSADHPYIITTPAGLDLLATKVNADKYYYKHFELGADIDYKDVPAKDGSGSNFTPIGKDRDYSFKGSFDGKEYTISGIVLNSENASFQGLFGYVGWSDDYSDNGPIVKNVTLASSTIKGANLVGGIAGGSAGMISNCTVKSDVKIYAQECGGILEYNNGFVENCTSSAQLEGNSNVGGIAGKSRRHGLANNRAIGVKISGTFQYAGAITPYTTNEDSLHNNFYLNCMVLDKTAGIGLDGEDFTKNNGAVPIHLITADEGITLSDNCIKYSGKYYSTANTVVTVSVANGYSVIVKDADNENVEVTVIDGKYSFTMPGKDVTLTKKAIEYRINYTLNGGSLPDGTVSPTSYTIEDCPITLPTPTNHYGKFIGWFDNSSFSGEPIETITANDAKYIKLYAKWNVPSITEIYNPDDLNKFAASVNAGNNYSEVTVTLKNDIDFNPDEKTTENFTTIGNQGHKFLGTFDGGGHKISGIRINKPDVTYQGLFGSLGTSATVKDVVLDNAIINGLQVNGGIVGENYGTVVGCTVKDVIIESYSSAVSGSGGIVGNNNGTVSYCTSSATIKGKDGNGGIAGCHSSGTLEGNIVTDATINGTDAHMNGAITSIQGQGTLKNNYYYNTTVCGKTTGVGCAAQDVNNESNPDGAVPALVIFGDSETTVTIEAGKTIPVVYLRKFKAGVTSTIVLPFDFDASSMYGIFYQLTSVNTDDWTAGANKVTGKLSANTPYLFLPNADIEQTVFTEVKLKPTTGDNSVTIDDNWTFHGVYEKILWETAPKNHYGFSGINKGNIAAGAFVKIGQYVFIKPTRAYLTYDDGISKSAIVLPDRIHVVFSDEEIASVIDPIDTPTDDPTEDITTPVSELPAQASNVKVWSYEKTIYIQAAPDTDYRIIDATGRVLRTATTLTDRDEIRLGNLSAIVMVIINNQTFKINY